MRRFNSFRYFILLLFCGLFVSAGFSASAKAVNSGQNGLPLINGLLNGMGEAAFGELTGNGRASLNFSVDEDGHIGGEGDILYPFYDGLHSTVFTQLGLRSMPGNSKEGERFIGNFGLGQRWFFLPIDDAARTAAAPQGSPHPEQAGNHASRRSNAGDSESPAGRGGERHQLMIGYNAFFDHDFTRSHQRGGIGLEAQWNLLDLAANYYFPLSGWKTSHDFNSALFEERPARGWDIRVKGYMPFYRNLAVTGAYSQWYGDNVGMFSSRRLERNPKVWSYGLEYTPVPLLSAFWNQRSTERGRSQAEFGLRLNWHFGMSWKDALSHGKVAELRDVSASRNKFVERENRIILEYRVKSVAETSAPLSLAVAGNPEASFADAEFYASAALTATAKDSNGNPVTINDGDVRWEIVSSSVLLPAWNRDSGAMNGLSWGQAPSPISGTQADQTVVSGTAPNGASATLTDIVGSRTVVLKAVMEIEGRLEEASVTLNFGPGPLSVFAGKPLGPMNWHNAAEVCGGAPGDSTDSAYQSGTKLPTIAQLQHVAGPGNGGYGAAHAAAWPDGTGFLWFSYWSGAGGGNPWDEAAVVYLDTGDDALNGILASVQVAVCVP